ncbi:tyrosine-type recombinase/integrase [Gordonia amarae]|uniref:tyrosine-type recombinase/integrase n=1 Tax=Gordonia amarae TaxID=36821 RepID=UPI001AFA9C18|nr:tyrosine-type recombinase/integrase [Gordonia amarae]QHN17929.1 tyrosine-type recombinase/integrase [Gordonia amarae]QHN22451.1 tyrosine-type recombinase/integrase [Gordonia amarae]
MATITSYSAPSKGGKKGILWEVRYRTPDRKQTRKRGFRTKKEAEDFAATTHVSKLRGEYIDPAEARITVGELGPAWLARQTHLKPSSERTAEVAWRVHVEPRWRDARLSDLRRSDIQQWISDMGQEETDAEGLVTKAGSGPVTVIRAYGVLAAILDEAVGDRRLLTNPARGVKLPRKDKKAHAYLTHRQVHDLAAEAGDKGVIVLVLAYTGLRWGELAGLHVADLDLLRRRVNVSRNAVNVGGVVKVGTPKTHELRSVALPRFLVELLAEACRGKDHADILFPATAGGYAKSPGANTWFSGAVDRCVAASAEARAKERKRRPKAEPTTPVFPRITPHGLRHTAASLAVQSGANVKAVQRMLGHASATMTLDTYADLFDTDLEDVADAMDAAVSKAIRVGPKRVQNEENGTLGNSESAV